MKKGNKWNWPKNGFVWHDFKSVVYEGIMNGGACLDSDADHISADVAEIANDKLLFLFDSLIKELVGNKVKDSCSFENYACDIRDGLRSEILEKCQRMKERMKERR